MTKLFISIKTAAKILGVTETKMREYTYRKVSPVPHFESGSQRYPELAGLIPWYRKYILGGAQVDYSPEVDVLIMSKILEEAFSDVTT